MKKEHNYGIDLLRTFLMLLIISGHLLVHTGIRESLEIYSPEWIFSWAYQAIALCAVNCFVLISGYFSNATSTKIKLKKILQLYGQVSFYSVAIYAVLLLTGAVKFSIIDAIHTVLPVLSGQYWFFSSYILLMLLMPFLNAMLSKLSDYSLKLLVGIIVAVFYVLPIFAIVFMQYDPTEGMGIIAFVTLYVIGYALKRFEINLSKIKCFIGIIINCAVIFISKIALTFIVERLNINAGTGLLYHYNTVFQLINAILLLLLFKNIKLEGKLAKATKFVGSSAFGVYLLHEHPHIRSIIWNEKLSEAMMQASFPLFLCLFFLVPIAIFVMCFALDKARGLIGKAFSKLAIINRLTEKLTELENAINKSE